MNGFNAFVDQAVGYGSGGKIRNVKRDVELLGRLVPVNPGMIVRRVYDLAVLALEHVVVLSRVSTVSGPRKPHCVPTARACGIKHFAVHC
jgi:hypothetical protein